VLCTWTLWTTWAEPKPTTSANYGAVTPLFIMYLRNRPAYYTNGEQTIAVNYSAHARDLEQTGWTLVEKVEVKVEPKIESAPEPVSEAVTSDTDLPSLTKSELLAYAEAMGLEAKSTFTKSEIISLIEAND
jgi:hypothetical protein